MWELLKEKYFVALFYKRFCSVDKICITFCALYFHLSISQSHSSQCQIYIERGGQLVSTEVNKTWRKVSLRKVKCVVKKHSLRWHLKFKGCSTLAGLLWKAWKPPWWFIRNTHKASIPALQRLRLITREVYVFFYLFDVYLATESGSLGSGTDLLGNSGATGLRGKVKINNKFLMC